MFFYSIDLSRINKRKRTNVYKIKKKYRNCWISRSLFYWSL